MEFLTYIVKSAGILTLFYLIYLLVLRKDTFFTANRTYLLTGIMAAIVMPFITFTTITFVEAPELATDVAFAELVPLTATTAEAAKSTIDIWQLVFWGYLAGVSIMLLHFLIQLASLLHLLRKHPSIKKNGFRFVEVKDDIAPFSFFNYIVFNPKTHDSEELEMILRHEKVHASQWHSIDLLLANLVRACQWANPISWFYKSSLEANLEFLADNETARYVPSKTAYQLALLKASSSLPVPALTNNFYHSFTRLNVFGREIILDFQNGQVKKRIIMLNKSNSNKYNQLKLTLVLPALALFLWSFNTVEVIEYKTTNTDVSSNAIKNTTKTAAALTFSAISSNAELDALQAFFMSNHPESLIKIANRKRDVNGNLVNFSFQTKFIGNDRFYTRFDRSTGAPFNTVYKIEPQDNAALLVSELGTDGAQFKITKENLEFMGAAAFASEKSTKRGQDKIAKEPLFGENPLYIVNGKEYRAHQLPKDKTIELDGHVEAFNKKDGKEKYGDKGKDGVLHFNGVSTFVPTKTEISEPTVSEEKSVQADKQQPTLIGNAAIKEVRIKITKNTTKEQLDTYKKELERDHDITFNYKNVDYNAKNEITSIAVSYKGKGMNGSYSVSEDDGKPIADFYFYMDTDKGTSGFGSESMTNRNEVREKMLAKRKELRSNVNEERTTNLKSRRNELVEVRELKNEERKQMRNEMAQLRKTQSNLREEKRNLVKEYARISQRSDGLHSNRVLITKNTSDSELAKMKVTMEAKGISFKYSRVKRNAKGEITRIRIESDNGKGSKQSITTNTHGGDAIDPIVIEL